RDRNVTGVQTCALPIFDESANIKVASERISFGKFTNAGQTCVAPDYLLVNRKVKNELISALTKTITEFYGENIQESPDYGRIVNEKHFNRLSELLNIHKHDISFGGQTDADENYIAHTILDGLTIISKFMVDYILVTCFQII